MKVPTIFLKKIVHKGITNFCTKLVLATLVDVDIFHDICKNQTKL